MLGSTWGLFCFVFVELRAAHRPDELTPTVIFTSLICGAQHLPIIVCCQARLGVHVSYELVENRWS